MLVSLFRFTCNLAVFGLNPLVVVSALPLFRFTMNSAALGLTPWVVVGVVLLLRFLFEAGSARGMMEVQMC